jgi:nucleoid DNA-binding protein/nucleoid-associated protein YgaU
MHEKFRYSQLVDLIARESGTSKQLIHNLFVELVKEIKADLQREGMVHLAGMGRFRLVWSEARQGRNPQTGEVITIPAHNRILFKPDAPIRRLINREYQQLKPIILEEKSQDKMSTLTEELEAAATFSPPPATPERIKESAPPKSAVEIAPAAPVTPTPPEKQRSTPESLKEKKPQRPVVEQPQKPAVKPIQPPVSPEPVKEPEPHKPATETQPKAPASPAPPIQSPVSPEPLKEAELSKPPVEKPKVVSPPPPVTVRVVTEDIPPAAPALLSQEEKGKKKIPVWIWIIPLVLIILLLFLFWPPADKTEPSVAEKSAAEVTSQQPSAQPKTETPPEPKQPMGVRPAGTPGGTHNVKLGDNLWGISTIYYKDAYLWPNILRVNLATVKNPDFLQRGLQIEVPGLQGTKGNWNSHDLEQIAEGYIHAYLLYHNRDKKNAIHYLWVARNANQNVYNKFKDQIDQADHNAILAIKGRSRY